MIELDGLAGLAMVRHGFLTREGGVSSGIYASLNCGPGSGDDPDSVARNRVLALERARLPAHTLVTAYQVHGADVLVVEDAPPPGPAPRVDAMVTRRPGICLGILTADCVPILFADPRAGIVGAAHAGWRGALKGVLEATIRVMSEMGARPGDMVAGIGPAIQQASYEVGPEFPGPFLEFDPSNRRWFQPGPGDGHWRFDLVGYVANRLARSGIGRIENSGLDTCADHRHFFSHRRMVHRGESDYGRQLSVIGLV